MAPGTIDDRAAIDFEDAEGQRFRLVDDGGAGAAHPSDGSPVPAEHQIRGFGPTIISVPKLEMTDVLLTSVLNMKEDRQYVSPDGQGEVHVYHMGHGGPTAELHVAAQPRVPMARQGAGAAHHVAFRTPDVQASRDWVARLSEFHVPNSGEVERYYFCSLYFREPAGNLFEIATDGPGFTVDESLESQGERLALPPFLEGKGDSIEANLRPLESAGNTRQTSNVFTSMQKFRVASRESGSI